MVDGKTWGQLFFLLMDGQPVELVHDTHDLNDVIIALLILHSHGAPPKDVRIRTIQIIQRIIEIVKKKAINFQKLCQAVHCQAGDSSV